MSLSSRVKSSTTSKSCGNEMRELDAGYLFVTRLIIPFKSAIKKFGSLTSSPFLKGSG